MSESVILTTPAELRAIIAESVREAVAAATAKQRVNATDLAAELGVSAPAPAAQGNALDAERYRWLRARWGRMADEYDGESDQLVAIRESDSSFEGWDVDQVSLDRAIDAARARQEHKQ